MEAGRSVSHPTGHCIPRLRVFLTVMAAPWLRPQTILSSTKQLLAEGLHLPSALPMMVRASGLLSREQEHTYTCVYPI